MAPNIGVMELHADVENIYNEASLARYCNANVTIFTTKLLYERVLPFFKEDKEDYNWVIQQKEESFRSFLKKIERHCTNEIDLLFINTFIALPHHQIFYYFFRPQCKIVHVVGRIERFFGKRHPIRYSSVRQFALSVLANASQCVANRTFPHFDGIWVENKDAYKYAVSAGYKKKISSLPFQYAHKKVRSHEYNGKLRFVTIGTVNDYRRDYRGLLNAFEKLFDSGRKNVALTVLGAPIESRGWQIVDRCRKLIAKGLDITFYTEHVPEEQIVEQISSADILISPNHVSMYGTGTFGAIVKAIQFAKPGIYPVNSLHHEELTSSSLFYDKIEELPSIIENLLSDPESIKELSQKAHINSEKFSLDKVAKDFQEYVLKKYLIDL